MRALADDHPDPSGHCMHYASGANPACLKAAAAGRKAGLYGPQAQSHSYAPFAGTDCVATSGHSCVFDQAAADAHSGGGIKYKVPSSWVNKVYYDQDRMYVPAASQLCPLGSYESGNVTLDGGKKFDSPKRSLNGGVYRCEYFTKGDTGTVVWKPASGYVYNMANPGVPLSKDLLS